MISSEIAAIGLAFADCKSVPRIWMVGLCSFGQETPRLSLFGFWDLYDGYL